MVYETNRCLQPITFLGITFSFEISRGFKDIFHAVALIYHLFVLPLC